MHHAAENSKYKTKQCKTFWNHGYCPYGGRCQFLHFEKEQVKPKAIMVSEVLEKQGGLNFPEKSQDSAYNTSAESITPPKLAMLAPPPVPRRQRHGRRTTLSKCTPHCKYRVSHPRIHTLPPG